MSAGALLLPLGPGRAIAGCRSRVSPALRHPRGGAKPAVHPRCAASRRSTAAPTRGDAARGTGAALSASSSLLRGRAHRWNAAECVRAPPGGGQAIEVTGEEEGASVAEAEAEAEAESEAEARREAEAGAKVEARSDAVEAGDREKSSLQASASGDTPVAPYDQNPSHDQTQSYDQSPSYEPNPSFATSQPYTQSPSWLEAGQGYPQNVLWGSSLGAPQVGPGYLAGDRPAGERAMLGRFRRDEARGGGVPVDPLRLLTKCRQFRREHRMKDGRLLVVQPMAVRQVDEVVDLLTDSFEDYFGFFSYRPFLRQQVSQYISQRVMIFPRGITLVGRIMSANDEDSVSPSDKDSISVSPSNSWSQSSLGSPTPVAFQSTDSSLESTFSASPSTSTSTSSPGSQQECNQFNELNESRESISSAPVPLRDSGAEAAVAAGASLLLENPFPVSSNGVTRRYAAPESGIRAPAGASADIIVGVAELSLGPPATPSFLTLGVPPGTAYIGNMAVRHEYRRQGIARALLEAAETMACFTEVKDVHLHCRLVDEAPYNLYSSTGYETVSVDHKLAPLLTWEYRRRLMRKLLS